MSHITLGALILAGGQNRRMGGSPKALLPNGSGALILDGLRAAFAGFDEKLLSTNTPELAAGTGFAPVPDARPGMGPLALWSPPVICPVLTGPQPSFWPALQTRAGPPGPCGTALAASTRSAASTPNSASRPFRRPSLPGNTALAGCSSPSAGRPSPWRGHSCPMPWCAT